jgi:hypothetical protein
MSKLELFEDWTIDYRLKQLRRCKDGWENGGHIDFIDFDSDLGQMIFEKMLLIDELEQNDIDLQNMEMSLDDFLRREIEIKEQIKQIEIVINKLEKETNK